jgi:hypothetical protein
MERMLSGFTIHSTDGQESLNIERWTDGSLEIELKEAGSLVGMTLTPEQAKSLGVWLGLEQ